MKKVFYSIFILLLLITSCINRGADEKYENLLPLKLGIVLSVNELPLPLMENLEIFDSIGLKVEIVEFPTKDERDKALLTDSIDGILADYTDIIPMQINGNRLKIVMRNDSPYSMITSSKSQIESLKELKGKIIAVSRDFTTEYVTDQILNQAGITLSNEVNKPEIYQSSLRLNMLDNGQIDATVFPEHLSNMALTNGNKRLISTTDLGITTSGIAVSPKAIQDKRRELEVFIKGYNQSVKNIQRSTEKKDLLYYNQASLPDRKDLETVINWLKQKELITEDPEIKQLTETIKGIKHN